MKWTYYLDEIILTDSVHKLTEWTKSTEPCVEDWKVDVWSPHRLLTDWWLDGRANWRIFEAMAALGAAVRRRPPMVGQMNKKIDEQNRRIRTRKYASTAHPYRIHREWILPIHYSWLIRLSIRMVITTHQHSSCSSIRRSVNTRTDSGTGSDHRNCLLTIYSTRSPSRQPAFVSVHGHRQIVRARLIWSPMKGQGGAQANNRLEINFQLSFPFLFKKVFGSSL